MKNSTLANSVFSVIKALGSLLFPVITFSYVSRIFLTDGIGRINFASSTVSIFSMLAMLGINYYGIRECSKKRDDKKALSKLFAELLSINLISTFFSYIILFCFVMISPRFGDYQSEIFLFSVSIVLGAIGVEWLYTAVEDYKYLAIRSIILQAISLIAVVLFVHRKEDINLYIVINVISSGLISIIGFLHARKYVDFRKIRLRDLGVHIRPIFEIFLVTIFIKIFTSMDIVMVGLLSSESEVGLYSASYRISSVLSAIIASATTIVMPKIAFIFEKDDNETANELLKSAIQYICLIGLPLAIGACVYSKNFIALLSGQSFIEATASSRILSFRALISPINGMLLLHYLIPRNNEKEAIIITSIAAISNILLNVCLIPSLGAFGASIATVLSEIIEFIIMVKYIRKYMRYSYIFEGVTQYIIAVIPVTIISIATLWLKHEVLSIVMGIVITVPVYAGILILLKNRYFDSGLKMIKGMINHG